jgi:hypothetical protein
MTVAEAGPGAGRLVTITGERGIDTDAPELDERHETGPINADLTVGTDVTRVVPLKANEGICHDGVKLHGQGFSIKLQGAVELGIGQRPGLEAYIRPYRNGRDLTGRTAEEVRGKLVIDFFGLTEKEVISGFPEVAQHLLTTVKAARDAQVAKSSTSDARAYAAAWWQFGKPRPELRLALKGLGQYLATVDTAKHRIFQLLEANVICDDKVVIVALETQFALGVLSSRMHLSWVVANQGLLESRPVYVKTRCFDPFPFPDPSPDQRARIAELAERLDATRKAALAENPKLTMTGLYNFVEAIRAGTLPPAQEPAAVRARARIVAKLHDDLDAAVAAAYGWTWPLPPAEIVVRLVALNAERAAEEAAGHVRWLRPEYQAARFGGG